MAAWITSIDMAILHFIQDFLCNDILNPIVVFITGLGDGGKLWIALAFAAGAMLYVVVEELIPECTDSQSSHTGTLGVMAGFLMMMILDVALG